MAARISVEPETEKRASAQLRFYGEIIGKQFQFQYIAIAQKAFLRIMPNIKGNSLDAGMVKLVYTTDSKSVAFGRGGSSPPTGTILERSLL